MSDSDLQADNQAATTQDSTVVHSAGAVLRAAREAQGVHIDTLAVVMKIPVKKLEALEADRYDLLPDTVFVRALASSICRTLKIEATQVLDLLPSSSAPHLKTDESGVNTPFKVSTEGASGAYFEQLSKPVVLAVLALLVGILVITFFPFSSEVQTESSPEQAVQPVEPTAVPLTDPALVLNSAGALAVPLESSSAVASVAEVGGLATTAPVVSEKLGEPATVGDLVSFKANGSSWVEVVDAQGVVQLRKTLRDGEVVSASGPLPLAVVVGRVDSTDVQVRGKPFDLTAVSKNNVARFEVK